MPLITILEGERAANRIRNVRSVSRFKARHGGFSQKQVSERMVDGFAGISAGDTPLRELDIEPQIRWAVGDTGAKTVERVIEDRQDGRNLGLRREQLDILDKEIFTPVYIRRRF